MTTPVKELLYFETRLKPRDPENLTGREWEVTIIGAQKAANVVMFEDEQFILSENGRLYSVAALQESVPRWDGVSVYDNHLTDQQYEDNQGMRSQAKEWLGNIVEPWFEAGALPKLKGILKVVDEQLASKLKNAWELGILGKKGQTGLSIDTAPLVTREAKIENQIMPIIDGFQDINSVDLVGRPAAGGGFDRLIAAQTTKKEHTMNEEEMKAFIAEQVKAGLAGIPELVKTSLVEALAAEEEEVETTQEADETEPEDTADETVTGVIDPALTAAQEATRKATREAQLATCQLTLERKLATAKLTPAFEKTIREAFAGKIFQEKELDTMVKNLKEAQISQDTTGRVTGAGGHMTVIDEADTKAAMLLSKLIGSDDFRALENHADDRVKERVQESEFLKTYYRNKPNVRYDGRVSELIRAGFLNGKWSLEEVSYKEALNLAQVIQDAVNVMIAMDYAGQNPWYEDIVDELQSDNPIDTEHLVRMFGATTLSIVEKGQPYTEMTFADEEETAAHIKKGNYVAVYLEDLLADKVGAFRTIPTRLSDAWYETLGTMVAGVFTTNSAAGPVLSDSGALFNNTAATTSGGHANLLTTALAWAAFDTVVTAMYNQTSRTLGTGRKLTDMGPLTILVPNALRATAYGIRNSETVPLTTANTSQKNPYGPEGDQPNVKVVPQWTDATDWAVLARYKGKSPIKLIFPSGARTPQIFTAESELAGTMFTNDTIRYKLRMMTYQFSSTYDVAPVVDWRLLHKSNVSG